MWGPYVLKGKAPGHVGTYILVKLYVGIQCFKSCRRYCYCSISGLVDNKLDLDLYQVACLEINKGAFLAL